MTAAAASSAATTTISTMGLLERDIPYQISLQYS